MRQHVPQATPPLAKTRLSVVLASIFFAFALWGNSGFALAETLPATSAQSPIVIVLDASGSMAARLGDEARLDAARRAVMETLTTLAPGRQVGLVAYGHRRKGDCADIETLSPVGAVDLPALKTALDGLRARGKTPLSEAMRQGASLLPAGGGTVMVVSDGLETCAADPCDVAAAIHAAQANVIFHIVGFGLAEGEMGNLACIAENSGGQAVEASDAAGLAEALTSLTDAVSPPSDEEVAPAESTPEPAAPPPPTPKPVSLRAMVGAEDTPGPVLFTVVSEAGETVYEGAGTTVTPDLVPGDYTVRVTSGNVRSESPVTVTGAADEQHEVPLEAGLVHLSVVAAKDLTIADTDLKGSPAWTLVPLGGQEPASVDTVLSPELMLAPGSYRVDVTLGGFGASADLDVATGAETELTLDLGLGKITLEAAVPGTETALESGSGLSWSLVPKAGTLEPFSAEAVAKPTFLVSAGDYEAHLRIGGADIAQDVTIEPGQSATARIDLPSAQLTLSGALGPDAPVFTDWRDASWTVRPVALIGGAKANAALENQAEASPSLVLTPGDWEITLVSGAASVTKRVTLAPGAMAQERIEVDAARLVLSAAPEDGATAPLNVVLSVFAVAEDGSVADTPIAEAGTSRDYALILPAGRYRIDALDETSRKASDEVDLAAGAETSLSLVLR